MTLTHLLARQCVPKRPHQISTAAHLRAKRLKFASQVTGIFSLRIIELRKHVYCCT